MDRLGTLIELIIAESDLVCEIIELKGSDDDLVDILLDDDSTLEVLMPN